MAIASLVLGIIGVLGCFIPSISFATLPLSIVGIILAVMAKKKMEPGKTGIVTAGLVLGIIGAALSLVGVICFICFCNAAAAVAASGGAFGEAMEGLSEAISELQ